LNKLKLVSRFIILFAFLFIGASLYLILEKDTSSVSHKIFAKGNNLSEKIIFLSDTQSPIWVETLILDRNNNESARDKIFSEVLSTKPKAVFHFGDLVAFGFSNSDWSSVDKFTETLSDSGIEFYPTLGNHELFLYPKVGENNFISRFPSYSKTGYSVIKGSLAIILLNSNFSNLEEEQILEQQEWYKKELLKLDNDSTISSIIVGSHHPPFTNSTIVNPNDDVKEKFVPPFISSNKCKIFLSGHSHAFEHFHYEGKDFLVLGGSGGLQQPLSVGNAAKWKDIYNSDTKLRRFHYVELSNEKDSLVFTVKMLSKDSSKFNDEYQLKLEI